MSKLALTASIAAGSTPYGSAIAPGAVTFSNQVTGDAVNAGTVTLVNPTYGSGGAVNAGSYAQQVGSPLSGADAGNYTFAGFTTATPNYTVSKLALTASIGAGSTQYGAAIAPGAVTFSNQVSGDVVNAGTVTLVNPTYSTGGAVNAGSYAQQVGGTLSGADAGNYTFAGFTTATPNYTVSKLALTASIAAGSTQYGSAIAPGAVTFSNQVSGDVVNAGTVTLVNPTYSTGGAVNAGSYAQQVGSPLSGADAGNYTFAGFTTATPNYTVSKLALILAGSKVYDSTTTFAAAGFGTNGTISTGINGETLVLTGSGSVTSPNVSSGTQTLNASGLMLNNGTGSATNYQIATTGNTGTINAATLTYVATAANGYQGSALPSLTGTVTGFAGSDTLVSATTGTLSWATSATSASAAGSYPIYGSGLNANFGNYVFVQALGNATALTMNGSLPSSGTTTAANTSPSQFTPAVSGGTTNTVNINFQSTGGNFGTAGTPIHITFTPSSNNSVANNNGINVIPGALSPGDALAHNHGLDFIPISEYDGNQYSGFKLPDYANQDSRMATLFTIIDRAVDQAHAADYMIDNFWNGVGDTWPGPGNVKFLDKVAFSNGADQDATPTNDPAFPIVPGKTDFAAMLKNGPILIGGAPGQAPEEWLLALNLAPDGKGIICDDPITGKLVELAYNPVVLRRLAASPRSSSPTPRALSRWRTRAATSLLARSTGLLRHCEASYRQLILPSLSISV